MPTRRPDKYTEVTEHARTISRNVDDFLEVERGGRREPSRVFYFIDFIDYKLFYVEGCPKKGAKGQTSRLIIERGDASIISHIALVIAKLKLFYDMRCTHSEVFVQGDMIVFRTNKLNLPLSMCSHECIDLIDRTIIVVIYVN